MLAADSRPAQAESLQVFAEPVGIITAAARGAGGGKQLWTYARATELLGTVRVVIMMSTVPVMGALLAIPLLGEAMSPGAAIGAAVTLFGALIGATAEGVKKPG